MSSFFRLPLTYVLLITILLSISACGKLAYYSQSVIGHSRLMLARKPVDKVLLTANDELKAKLILANQLRQFAVDELGLPKSKSYSTYVALERDFPVWTVVAAPEFSVHAKQWCYPVIGCASYRGYFNKQHAVNYAQTLSEKGFETSVGGAPAYSTLGWFSDPLLPSMMRYGDNDFAETLFHEIAHQLLYINGDSAFNEAFATAVGQEGTRRWLAKYRPNDLLNYQQELDATRQFNDLLSQFKVELEQVYLNPVDDQQKRQDKQQAFSLLAHRYEQMKEQQWNGKAWFDRWFSRPINNARLASFSTYYDKVPLFQALLSACDGDLTRFYETVSQLKKQAKLKNAFRQIPTQCLPS